jgi:hypothetical protein
MKALTNIFYVQVASGLIGLAFYVGFFFSDPTVSAGVNIKLVLKGSSIVGLICGTVVDIVLTTIGFTDLVFHTLYVSHVPYHSEEAQREQARLMGNLKAMYEHEKTE